MGKLVYTALMSLDGYIEDKAGSFDWAVPDDEVHSFINDLERQAGTFLMGRRMYETMAGWEDPDNLPDLNPTTLDFAQIWRSADKVVYSTTQEKPSTARTRVERSFDAEAVRQMKAMADRGLTIGGPALAAHAFTAGLVDECHLFLAPILVGGGKRGVPDGILLRLELLDERRFGNGMVYLRYAVG